RSWQASCGRRGSCRRPLAGDLRRAPRQRSRAQPRDRQPRGLMTTLTRARAMANPVPDPTAATQASSQSVLVVEDDSALRVIIAESLRAAGYAVEAVGDGALAVQTLDARPRPDVVLLDIGLPHVDGWQILQTFGGRGRPAIIVISARGNERDKVRALDL